MEIRGVRGVLQEDVMELDPLVVQEKQARMALNLTCGEAGQRVGADKSAVASWERGQYRPSGERRERLARWLQSDEVRSVLDGASAEQKKRDQEEQESEYLCIEIAGLLNVLTHRLMPPFTEGTRKRREAFRENLKNTDLSYVLSMLEAMMKDEGAFQRWKALTTHDYESFGLRRAQNGTKEHRTPHRQRDSVSRSNL